MNELYHHGVKGMRWGVRQDRKIHKIEKKADKAISRGTISYKARQKEFYDKKKLYDKYGVNKDFESKHNVVFSYKKGKDFYAQSAIYYKDCIVSDKGGIITENGKTSVSDDGELVALQVYSKYGQTGLDSFYKNKTSVKKIKGL